MKMNVNSNGYTYTFALVLVVLVAVLLSAASLGLKERQNSNVKQEKMQSILSSVGVEVDRSEAQAAFDKIIANVYTIKGGAVVSEDRETGFDIDMAEAIKSENMDREVPLYVANKEGETFYIVPLRGKGLWGPIWGYLSLKSDGNTVVGATFDHKSETPGLGAEITTPMFTDAFPGKKISEDGAYKSISVVKKGSVSSEYAVDGISGGTITSNGVNDMLMDCLAPYAEYFKNI
jgi:Na+-transporting NADH:ubiquinone oxidoreductase subunit C